MKCTQCSGEMKSLGCFDAESCRVTDKGRYSMNFYFCGDCMILARENVWDFPGVVWIYPNDLGWE